MPFSPGRCGWRERPLEITQVAIGDPVALDCVLYREYFGDWVKVKYATAVDTRRGEAVCFVESPLGVVRTPVSVRVERGRFMLDLRDVSEDQMVAQRKIEAGRQADGTSVIDAAMTCSPKQETPDVTQ